ncbi:MAG: Dna2/Cas4 domain-containing protein [Candidatus Poseidoniaceae archaeon]|nr:Dna2/Cas4 domain-containing protein [Candidatus Poseidoniaceae archaeon]MBL6889331.1 Dna2/Cas4 domain-containing protein [Candidatus Poseidoniaceae archaeon]
MGVTFAEGSEGPDGFYLDSNGNPLPVSASELERYTYCPVSWRLAKEGAAGVGEAITIGMEKHKQIHEGMNEFQTSLIKLRRELLIWSWWYGIIIAFAIDAVAFVYIDDLMNAPIELAKILSMWSVSFLAAAILSIVIPWRNWLNMEPTVSEIETLSKNFESTGLKPTWNPIGFLGGWFSGGKTEAGLLLATIVIGLHAIGLAAADNRSQAGFILVVTAFVWTFLATWQLQKSLFAENEMIEKRGRAGLDEDTQLVYSDDDESSGLLRDEETGLRGRPDQIVIIDGEFIPVEQKTGRVPKKPHQSHRVQLLAYISLVETNTKKSPPYGILKYGEEDVHQVFWDQHAKNSLLTSIKKVQKLMVEGGAKRNHEREGKCRNCSRRHACEQSLFTE